MINRKLDVLIEEHYANTQNALLLSGARQVGKSYAIRKYGKANYSCFVEINFIEQPQAIQIFQHATSATDLLLRLSTFVQQPLVEGDTLIFFDEVQVYPDILTWIKFLVDSAEYRYALSGSLLGVQLNLHDMLHIVGIYIRLYCCRHTANNQVEINELHHFFMHHFINGRFVLPGVFERIDGDITHTNGSNKLLKAQRIDLNLRHVSYRKTTYIFQLHS